MFSSMYKAAKRHFRRMHKQALESFMKSQFDQIDRLFWNYVNSRRKRSGNSAGSNINFDGRNVFNEREITNEWANYFTTLYTPLESPNFDDSFKDTVGICYEHIMFGGTHLYQILNCFPLRSNFLTFLLK